MRSVCFVERLLLNYSGSLFPEAVRLADVDGDGLNELLVGDTSGKLNIYKHDGTKPFYSCSSLGMITCVGVGDVCNKGKDIIVCLSGEGWCYLFELPMIPGRAEVPGPAEGHTEKDTGNVMKPCFNQHTPANSKAILIGDVDGDGLCELVIGYTDNVVRAFRWQGNASKTSEEQFVQVAKWILDGQVSNLTLNGRSSGPPELMASQPGCTYTTLLFQPAPGQVGPATRDCDESSFSQIYDILLHQTSCRSKVDSCILGNVTAGSLKLMEQEKQLWSLHVDNQMFAMGKVDITCDGSEEVVACAWDGQTYIIDRQGNVVRFQFDDNVCAFSAGLYAYKGNVNSPCLVFATLSQRLFVYWNVQLKHMESTNLFETLGKYQEFHDLLRNRGLDSSDPCAVQQLVRDVLYQWPQLCSNTNDKTKTHVG
uniref:KICSTOR complex protein ITFG2 isoform X4 n=1 Tax=Myxine glutinosa TaxID=7769 RepID=UPI00358DFC0F